MWHRSAKPSKRVQESSIAFRTVKAVALDASRPVHDAHVTLPHTSMTTGAFPAFLIVSSPVYLPENPSEATRIYSKSATILTLSISTTSATIGNSCMVMRILVGSLAVPIISREPSYASQWYAGPGAREHSKR